MAIVGGGGPVNLVLLGVTITYMSDESNIAGMTVNERLNHFGLVAEFDAAIRTGSKAAAIRVLTQGRFTPEQAEYTASQVLSAPARYGYQK